MTQDEVFFGRFEWSQKKAIINQTKHGVDFFEAIEVFIDEQRLIAIDDAHSLKEDRFYCVGRVGVRILTVRFTYRKDRIRIFGAGCWRKGKKLYEEENSKIV